MADFVAPVDGVSWAIRGYWDEDGLYWSGEEILVDNEVAAMFMVKEIGAKIKAKGKGDTFIEVTVSTQKWSRSGDGVLRWHGSKKLFRSEEFVPTGPKVEQQELSAPAGKV